MIRRALVLGLIPGVLWSQQNWDTVTVKAQPIRGGVYVITGRGGNIGLSVGNDGAFLVDDQYAPLTPKILAAIAGVTSKPVRFVVNTHWHFDHTGGNENVGKAGALIVAHDNVRRRMSTDQLIEFMRRTEPAAPKSALPVVTFTDTVTFHVNDDELVAFHVAPAHTDGDAIVHFTKANVIHMGDVFVLYGYPFVDLSSGGNVGGIIAASDRALAVCNSETRVIPGHGAVTDCATLRAYRDMVATIHGRVSAAMRAGKSLDAIKAAKPTADFDSRYRGSFVNGDQFVEFTYRSLGGT